MTAIHCKPDNIQQKDVKGGFIYCTDHSLTSSFALFKKGSNRKHEKFPAVLVSRVLSVVPSHLCIPLIGSYKKLLWYAFIGTDLFIIEQVH